MQLSEAEEIQVSDGKVLKIAVVGDLHLNSSTPKSRVDDYPTTCINKLETLRLHLLKNGCTDLILLGDIFHKPSQPVKFLNRVLREFLLFKSSGIKVRAIAGN